MIRLVIASLLKPFDEVRMYKRIGISLAKTNKYEVNIIGIESKNKTPAHPNIQFHVLPNSGRGILNRTHNLRTFRKLVSQLRPAAVIVTSPDLLFSIVNHKSPSSLKIIYDLQEDYYKNIIYQRVYSSFLRPLLANAVRGIEQSLIKKIDKIILAEKIYQQEIPFCRSTSKTIVLENKYAGVPPTGNCENGTYISLLFTGTVSHYAGVLNAVKVYDALQQIDKSVQLKIVGICHDRSLKKHLHLLAENDQNISLIGLDEFVSHEVITSSIQSADIGIIGYEPNEINKNKVPSKLYEYQSLQLPTIVKQGTQWHDELAKSNLAIPVQFDNVNAATIIKNYQSLINSDSKTSTPSAHWESEEPRLLAMMHTLFTDK